MLQKSPKVVNAGQLSIIKPNVAHDKWFLQKTLLFLNLVRGERDHENYGNNTYY